MKIQKIAIALLIIGCFAPGVKAQTTRTRVNVVPAPATIGHRSIRAPGWEFRVTDVRSVGQIFNGQYMTYEAADTWIAVSVTIRNTSGKRQSTEDIPFSNFVSTLVDFRGNTYNSFQRELKYDTDRLFKPLTPGETRSEVWLFDVPRGTQAQELMMDLFSIQQGTVSVRL
ncbi:MULTISPECIES: DUF4352 domain-containing protein [unclassified Coleofasciculus]|uniref:DUF4352 domain-containing protein n=1 Tax=unclassified Coleofasciculus TaxID=2692782 RepID=UPI001881F980|nr:MULTISPECIES: DUF4352 domain-containing protein [unclassified Coleofasciculus]MBE9125603.1 DUF4352 domain-containing protein [Coleofasciculus sp. LEGE 07081]MBE9147317.1 DUF4352 domain-containing protein [Coleofasciculus sp. LEGE 07092]